MRWKYLCILFFLLHGGFIEGDAQVTTRKWINSQHFGALQGLRTAEPGSGVRDSLGRYWFLSFNTLHRFNGHAFTDIPVTRLGLNPDGRHHLLPSPDDYLWIISRNSTWEGMLSPYDCVDVITLYNPYNNTQQSLRHAFTELPFDPIEIHLACAAKDQVFITTFEREIYSYNGLAWSLVGSFPQFDLIHAVMENEGVLFFVADGSLWKWDGRQAEFLSDVPVAFQEGQIEGDVLLMQSKTSVDKYADSLMHVFLYDLKSGCIFSEGSTLDGEEFYGLTLDHNGQLWARWGEQLNIYRLEAAEQGLKLIHSVPFIELFPGGLRPFFGIPIDGDIWLMGATEMVVCSPQVFSFDTYPATEKISVRSIYPLTDSTAAILSYSGLLELNLETGKLINRAPSVNAGVELFHLDSSYYVGTHGRALDKIDQSSWSVEEIFCDDIQLYQGIELTTPFLAIRDSLFIACSDGIRLMIGDTFCIHLNFPTNAAWDNPYIENVVQDGEKFWLATSSGAFLFDPYHLVVEGPLPSNPQSIRLHDLQLLDDGKLALLPKNNDPIIWDIKDSTGTELDLYDERLQNTIHSFIPDGNGSFWLSTNNGLFQYQKESGRVFQFTMEQHELPSYEFNRLAFLKYEDGSIFMGGINGLIRFSPSQMNQFQDYGKIEPSLKITAFQGMEEGSTVWTDLFTANKNSRRRKQISTVIAPYKYRRLQVKFEYPNYQAAQLQYFYRIFSLSSAGEWQRINAPYIELSNLASEDYRLDIAVKGERDLVFKTITSQSFSISPPWYKQPQITILYIAFIILGFYMYLRYRLWREEKVRIKLETIVLERTREIDEDRQIITSQKEELERINKAKDKLMALLGHELHRPILQITNFGKRLAYLLKKQEFRTIERISDQLEETALNTQYMLGSLLSWGQVMLGHKKAKPELAYYAELVGDAIQNQHALITEKALHIIDNTAGYEVYFDVEALTIIIRNFLINAIKFTPPHGTIRIGIHQNEKETVLSVHNEGSGFPKFVLQRFNETHFFYSELGTAGEKGVGLGLNLCNYLASQNGAKIRLTNPQTGGAKVELVQQNSTI